ncbi:hypothetical protein PIB30_094994 [Stylosanthes scabra]|uniref:Uncharacterized protein n=1 Tax=Stylosanthes scabra TaxID=79078 RepID=A0ABU6UZ75_9FABA|nr:hypothetical protein [Stylosanthes scabra]
MTRGDRGRGRGTVAGVQVVVEAGLGRGPAFLSTSEIQRPGPRPHLSPRLQSSPHPPFQRRPTHTQTTTGSEEPPPPEPEPMPWPPVNNPLSEGEEEDIDMEEELARQAGRVYLHWDDGNW